MLTDCYSFKEKGIEMDCSTISVTHILVFTGHLGSSVLGRQAVPHVLGETLNFFEQLINAII